jgi:hypothetical protein
VFHKTFAPFLFFIAIYFNEDFGLLKWLHQFHFEDWLVNNNSSTNKNGRV